jgi:Na+/glutamate symporter
VGVNEYTARMENINLSGGHTNAASYCTTMFNFPTFPELLENFNNQVLLK